MNTDVKLKYEKLTIYFHFQTGASSVHFQMLNRDSRKYFNRIFAISGSAFSRWALRQANHVRELQEFSKISEINHLVEYLKSEYASNLTKIYPYKNFDELRPTWVPTIESPNIIDAFMTKTPLELYQSDEVPIMDTMFSFTAQVIVFFTVVLVICRGGHGKREG